MSLKIMKISFSSIFCQFSLGKNTTKTINYKTKQLFNQLNTGIVNKEHFK